MNKKAFGPAELAGLVGLGQAGIAGLAAVNQNPEPHERETGPVHRGLVRSAKTLAGYAVPAAITYGLASGLGPAKGTLLGTISRGMAIPAGLAGGAMLPGLKMGSIQDKVAALAKMAIDTEQASPEETRRALEALKAKMQRVNKNPNIANTFNSPPPSGPVAGTMNSIGTTVGSGNTKAPPPNDFSRTQQAAKSVAAESSATTPPAPGAAGSPDSPTLSGKIDGFLNKNIGAGTTVGSVAPAALVSGYQAAQGNRNDPNSGGLVQGVLGAAGAVGGQMLTNKLLGAGAASGVPGFMGGILAGRLLPGLFKMNAVRDLAKVAVEGSMMMSHKKPNDDGMTMCKECKMKHERGLCKQAAGVGGAPLNSGLNSYTPVRSSGIQERLGEIAKNKAKSAPVATPVSGAFADPANYRGKQANEMLGYNPANHGMTQPMGAPQGSPFTKQVGAPIDSGGSFGPRPVPGPLMGSMPPAQMMPHMAPSPMQAPAPAPSPMMGGSRGMMPPGNIPPQGPPSMAGGKPAGRPMPGKPAPGKSEAKKDGDDDKKDSKKKDSKKKDDKKDDKEKEASDVGTFTNRYMAKWNTGSMESKLNLYKGGASLLRKSVLPVD